MEQETIKIERGLKEGQEVCKDDFISGYMEGFINAWIERFFELRLKQFFDEVSREVDNHDWIQACIDSGVQSLLVGGIISQEEVIFYRRLLLNLEMNNKLYGIKQALLKKYMDPVKSGLGWG